MILTFTGTRAGMTGAQLAQFEHEIAGDIGSIVDDPSPVLFIHGGAEGADTMAHNAVMSALSSLSAWIGVQIYPCISSRERYWRKRYEDSLVVVIHPIIPPLVRNNIMVQRCGRLIATPSGFEEELRSGTWATIRYARKYEKRITIILPDGSVMEE